MPKQIRVAEITLEKMVDRLQKYCHLNGCENYAACPKACYECGDSIGEKLDLDTGIAWDSASGILEFLSAAEGFNDTLHMFNCNRSEYVKYKRKNDSDREHHFDEMKSMIEELEDDFEELTVLYFSVASCISVVAYHHTKYIRLYNILRRSSELMNTAHSSANDAIRWCKSIYGKYELKERSSKDAK